MANAEMAIDSCNGAAGSSHQEATLCGTPLGPRAHICAFFRSDIEEDHALLPFIKEGLAAGEKVFHTIDPAKRGDKVDRLAAANIDFAGAHRRGQFDICPWTETHLDEGRFDPAKTLAFFRDAGRGAARKGFSRSRFVTHMEWALEDGVVLTDLLAYEAEANDIWLKQTGPIDPVICVYDLKRFSGEVIVDVLRTHPMTLIDGILHENPFFVPPEDFMRELGARRPPRGQ